jgi:stage V sporulation protein B
MGAGSGDPSDDATEGRPSSFSPDGLGDPGAARNTLLQLLSQVATVAFTGGLTFYLVRALGPSGYGVYALAFSIGGLLLHPAGFGLPMAVGRFVADHRTDVGQARAILLMGLKLQVPAALVTGLGLFALSGVVADAYGQPRLGWPLRWMALAVVGQALFSFLTSMSMSVRRVIVNLWMVTIESATETSGSVALVVLGGGAAGAMLGKAIGYGVGSAVGLYLMLRLVRHSDGDDPVASKVDFRTMTRYAGAMLVVDVAWSAIAQVDVLLIGGLLTTAAVGSFSAVLGILTVLGYLGVAVSAGVAPRLSLGNGPPDTRAFSEAIRYLIIVQGLAIAPMLVWSRPIIALLLGPRYGNAPEILRVLTVVAFVSAPASLISVTVTYLGEGRRRVAIMIATLVLGLLSTYVLLRTVGLIGAAIADDLVQIVYVSAHLWICSRMIAVDLRRLARSTARTLIAAGAMVLPMLAVGTNHLSVADWLIGLSAGGASYIAALLVTRELSVGELRGIVARLRS